jgi:hypothetical protein
MDIAGEQLGNQLIANSSFERPEEVVGWMGALQALEGRDGKG